MDFRTELAKYGYNKGNSIDVETLIDEILPSLFSQQERSYSEEEVKQAYIDGSNNPIEEDDCYGTEFFEYMDDWFEQFKKK